MTEPYTAADVQLVAEAMADASGAAYAYEYERWAPYVLRALAEAGRLLPDGAEMREEWRIDAIATDDSRTSTYRDDRDAALRLARGYRRGAWRIQVFSRTIIRGPWVEADEDGTT